MRIAPLLLIVTACGVEGMPSPFAFDEQDSAATGQEARNLGAAARIYRFSTSVERCSSWSLDENYSSGRYNAHRYAFNAEPRTTVELTFARQRATWQPAIIIVTSDGTKIYDGETALSPIVTADLSGRTGALARVQIKADTRTALYAYATSWEMIAGRFEGNIPRTAEYTFAINETCEDIMGGNYYAGIDRQGSHIPRAGLANATLRRALGVAVEPYGDVVVYDGSEYVSGTISWFGGHNDTGVTPTETGAITGERLRSLTGYFAAMRFDYTQNGVAFWRDQRLLVINPNNGVAVIVRPVDWGPNTRTRRLIDLSQETLVALGLSTDDEALVSFADPGAPLGPVE